MDFELYRLWAIELLNGETPPLFSAVASNRLTEALASAISLAFVVYST